MNTLIHIFKQFIAATFIVFGIVMLLLFGFVSWFSEDVISNNPITFILLVVCPFVTGVLMMIIRSFNKRSEDNDALEVKIVNHAQSNFGIVSIPEISIRLKIAPVKAHAKMRELAENGIFESRITEEGAVVYKLISYASSFSKQNSNSVI